MEETAFGGDGAQASRTQAVGKFGEAGLRQRHANGFFRAPALVDISAAAEDRVATLAGFGRQGCHAAKHSIVDASQ